MTDVYGIFGFPVSHSLSPAMHNRAFAELGLDAVYVPFAVAPEALAEAVRGVRAPGLRGLNVTLPHKTSVMAHLDHVEPDARVIGAVNTLYWQDERLCGKNTDAEGLARSLLEARVQLEGARVTVLGAGGAARATVVGLARAGAAQVTLAARRESEAEALAHELRSHLSPCELSSTRFTTEALRTTFERTDLLVQATSATLGGGPHADDFANALPFSALPAQAVVTDLVYKPRITRVMQNAHARELRTVDGLGMLLHQGALAFERWTGRPAPVAVMRHALETALSR
jgi:shikimate dehydrogenase